MSNSFNERSVPQKYRRELKVLKAKDKIVLDTDETTFVKTIKFSKYRQLKSNTISKPNAKNNNKTRYSKSRITRNFYVEDGD